MGHHLERNNPEDKFYFQGLNDVINNTIQSSSNKIDSTFSSQQRDSNKIYPLRKKVSPQEAQSLNAKDPDYVIISKIFPLYPQNPYYIEILNLAGLLDEEKGRLTHILNFFALLSILVNGEDFPELILALKKLKIYGDGHTRESTQEMIKIRELINGVNFSIKNIELAKSGADFIFADSSLRKGFRGALDCMKLVTTKNVTIIARKTLYKLNNPNQMTNPRLIPVVPVSGWTALCFIAIFKLKSLFSKNNKDNNNKNLLGEKIRKNFYLLVKKIVKVLKETERNLNPNFNYNLGYYENIRNIVNDDFFATNNIFVLAINKNINEDLPEWEELEGAYFEGKYIEDYYNSKPIKAPSYSTSRETDFSEYYIGRIYEILRFIKEYSQIFEEVFQADNEGRFLGEKRCDEVSDGFVFGMGQVEQKLITTCHDNYFKNYENDYSLQSSGITERLSEPYFSKKEEKNYEDEDNIKLHQERENYNVNQENEELIKEILIQVGDRPNNENEGQLKEEPLLE